MIDKRSFLYEILIRFDASGYKGGHAKDLTEVFDTETGEVFSAIEGEPRAITAQEAEDYIGKANATFAADFEAALALRTAALEAALAAVTEERDAALADMASCESRLASIAALAT